MKSFWETLSGRVEKVRWWLGIKAKKIVEQQSKQIADVFASPMASVPHTVDAPQASVPMEVAHSPNDLLNNQSVAEHHEASSSSEWPSAMAA